MAEYITPGVYINEFDKLNWVAEGPSTTTGVVGTSPKGKAFDIELITSYDDYVNEYGKDSGYLDFFARFFFKLGGKRLKVVRATDNFRYAGLAVSTKGFAELNEMNDNTNYVMPEAWQNVDGSTGFAYSADDYVSPITENDFIYICTVGGTASPTEPTWPVVNGDTVADGGVTWQAIRIDENNIDFTIYTHDMFSIANELILTSTGNVTNYSTILNQVPMIKPTTLVLHWTGKEQGEIECTGGGWDNWIQSTAYNLGDVVLQDGDTNGTAAVMFQAESAGTSGVGSSPTGSVGDTGIADGTLTWKCIDYAREILVIQEQWDYAGEKTPEDAFPKLYFVDVTYDSNRDPLAYGEDVRELVAEITFDRTTTLDQIKGTVNVNSDLFVVSFKTANKFNGRSNMDVTYDDNAETTTFNDTTDTPATANSVYYEVSDTNGTAGSNDEARSATDNGTGSFTLADELTDAEIDYNSGAFQFSFIAPPTANTNIWVEYDQLYSGIRSDDTTIKLVYDEGLNLDDWPEAGIVKIEDEYIRYGHYEFEAAATTDSGKDEITLELVQRGILSEAEDHFENEVRVRLVSNIVNGTVDGMGVDPLNPSESLGGVVNQGDVLMKFKSLSSGILPDSGTIHTKTNTNGVTATIDYIEVHYDDNTKTTGWILFAEAWFLNQDDWAEDISWTYIPGGLSDETPFILEEDKVGGFSGATYEKYQEWDGWNQPLYDNDLNIIDPGGVEEPTEDDLFFNIMARYPGDFANGEIMMSIYTKKGWNDAVDVPYYYNKIDEFPLTHDELLVVVEDAYNNQILEYFLVSLLTEAKDDWGHTKYIIDKINNFSEYIRIFMNPDYRNQVAAAFVEDTNGDITGVIPNSIERYLLAGGTDGINGQVSDGKVIQAFDLFRDKIDVDLDLLTVGGYTSRPVQNNVISICESRRDCFGILSIPYGLDIEEAVDFKEKLTNTTFAGLYYNWFTHFDSATNSFVKLPPAVQVTGLFIKNDFLGETWSAPAGYNRTSMIEIQELENKLNTGDIDVLYMNSINPCVNFNNGPVIWGIKTLSYAQSAFSKINIRRLLIQMEKDIGRSMKQFMFEPNVSTTRTRVKMTIDPYLDGVKAREGIIEALVVCDDTNNPYETQMKGQLIVDLYIKPVFAIEYIILNFIVTKDVIRSSVTG